jgi:serine/threonine-protein kinase
MLSGRVPFQSTTPLGYLRKHMLEDPPPFRAVAPGLSIPPQVEAVVMKALKKEREDRYPTALEFAHAFAAAAPPASAAEVNQPLPSTKIVAPPTTREPVAPAPQLASAAAPADIAVQTPPHVSAPGIVEPPSARRQVIKPPPATSPPPAVGRPPHFRVVESPSRTKYVIPGVLLVAAIAAGIWYFSRPAPPPLPITSGSPDTSKSPSASMVAIPGATFTMGRNNASEPQETPPHLVSVAAFNMDKRPATNAQYAEFVKSTRRAAPSGWANGTYPEGQAEWPVTGVSWEDANAYCTSKGLRLPTEAEWEYAARGADGRLYPWGNDFSAALTNSAEAALGRPEAVGAHRDAASPFGVLDMSGNVWQWTADDYRPYPGRQPTFVIPPDAKVIRGGSYQSDRFHVTTTTRNLDHASTRSALIGFRCVK